MKLPRIQDQSSLYDGNSRYEAAAIVYTQDQSTFLVPLLRRMKKDMRVVCGWFQGRHKMWLLVRTRRTRKKHGFPVVSLPSRSCLRKGLKLNT